MGRRRSNPNLRRVNGILLLDKPAGLTSNAALQVVKKLYAARKAGHTGSLDPLATGLLPLCFGEATKVSGFLLDADKDYQVTCRLGERTSTGDAEGEVLEQCPVDGISEQQLREALGGFVGDIEQIPPMYSALKHQGQPLYRLARAGQEVPRQAREVTIHRLQLVSWELPFLEFRVRCSKGTYVRTLAEDIAQAMGSCAHLQALRRLAVEPFQEQGMVTLDQLETRVAEGLADECLLPPDAGLAEWPVVRLDEMGERRFRHGNPVAGSGSVGGLVRVYGPGGKLLGLGEVTADGTLKARRLMHLEALETR
jgi:tRNA pseudouridine55 synthase